MTQLEFRLYPEEVNVHGYVDARGIRYIGTACRDNAGKWRCLADLNGVLCVVQCSIKEKTIGDQAG